MNNALKDFARDLKRKIKGEVRLDSATRAIYAQDASNYRQIPLGAVIPRSADEIVETVALCRKYELPILSRGAGTSIAGQTCNAAIILDHSKFYNQIINFSESAKTITVQPGLVLDHLNRHVREKGLIFGPDPATHSRCTLGGMIGNNSCGIHSLNSGKVVENIISMQVLTYDGLLLDCHAMSEQEILEKARLESREGRIYQSLIKLHERYGDLVKSKFPTLGRRVSGYNLDELNPEKGIHLAKALVGTEGTCVTILNAQLKLIKDPPFKQLVILGFPDIFTAAAHNLPILETKPHAMEGLDTPFIGNMRIKGMHRNSIEQLPEGNAWLFLEYAGFSIDEVREKINQLIRKISLPNSHYRIFFDPRAMHAMWAVRESAFGATVFVPNEPDVFAGWEDAAVPPEKLESYLRAFDQLLKKFGYSTVLYGHFGEGCIHSRISFDLKSAAGIKQYRHFMEEAADLVISLDGSISGEHGDGQARAELLPKMFGPHVMEAFREFKEIWDPDYKMNPGKIIRPYRMDENLKFSDAPPKLPQQDLYFRYPDDQGNLFTSLQRCIGIGRCRKHEDGLMCPSYRATLEEKHSTRGRARILYEMMRGEIIDQGWQNSEVKASLALCLSCKSCKSECPTNVDMAAYKAEFLAHYYQKHKRPLRAVIFGKIAQWVPWASRFHFLINPFRNLRFGRNLLGITDKRDLPAFAPESFRSQFQASKPQQNRKVLLWADTFADYFYPQTLHATAQILQALGFSVALTKEKLCCGRPLYDYGYLSDAKNALNKIMNALKDDLDAGTVVIGIEPGCISVFRDELLNFFPQNDVARKLSHQSFLLSEFLLSQKIEHLQVRDPNHPVYLFSHCHQKSLWPRDYDYELLRQLGANVQLIGSGCCGMAGAFGFDKDHYDVSLKTAQISLDALNQLPAGSTVIANGFSCREQLKHVSTITPIHLAEYLKTQLPLSRDAKASSKYP